MLGLFETEFQFLNLNGTKEISESGLNKRKLNPTKDVLNVSSQKDKSNYYPAAYALGELHISQLNKLRRLSYKGIKGMKSDSG